MENVSQIKPCANPQTALRNIADGMDAGSISTDNVTVVAGIKVFQCGDFDESRAVENAIYNLNYAIHKLMNAAVSEE